MNLNVKRVGLASASIVAMISVLGANPAWAQVGSGEDAAFLTYDEIIVTARKRDESLLEIPVAVSVFAQDAIIDFGATDIDELSDFASGFEFVNDTRVNTAIRFRGLGAVIESPASRSGAVFWEGGYVSDGVPFIPLIDVERVEVIKGPQNAFFGRNTFSGAVNFIPKEPGDEFGGMLLTSYSPTDNDSYNITAALGGPITDTLGVRVAGSLDRDGADFFYGNGDPNGEIQTASFSGTVVWQPTDVLKFKASGFYASSRDTISQVSQAPTVAAGDCDLVYSGNLRDIFDGSNLGSFSTDLSQGAGAGFCGSVPDFDEQPPWISPAGSFASPEFADRLNPFSANAAQASAVPAEFANRGGLKAPDGLGGKYGIWRINLSGQYEFSDGSSINASLARGVTNNWNIGDGTFGRGGQDTSAILLVGFIRWTRDTSAEIRYTSNQDERLRYNIGVSYYSQDLNSSDVPFLGGQVVNIEDGENIGIFGSLDFDVTDAFTVSLEGRWNKDTQTVVFNGQTGQTDGLIDQEQSYDRFMPRVILSYQINENANVYGSYSRSFIQGIATNAEIYGQREPDSGINLDTVGVFTPVQQLDAFEIGIKHNPAPWLRYALATYYLKWQNQVFPNLSPSFQNVNLAGDSRIFGLELEGTVQPTSWLEFTGAFNYNDVEFTDFGGSGSTGNRVLAPGLLTGGSQIDANGFTPRYISQFLGSLSTVVQVGELINYDPGAFVRLDAIYTGDFFVDNFAYNEVNGYTRLNARAGVNIKEGLTVDVFANNLTNNLSWGTTSGTETSFPGTPDRILFGTLPRKREYGIRVRYDF